MNICFIAHFAYGAMAGGCTGHIGGVERQITLMARWLAGRGHNVSLLTWDEGTGGDVIIDGVRVYMMAKQDAGIPGLRFFVPRWSSLNRALAKADARIYYHNCAEYVTGQVALWCRLKKRKFVYSVASEPDCDPKLPIIKTFRERILYRYGLQNADQVIVQTASQKQMLQDGFSVSSVVLPMPCDGPAAKNFKMPSPPDQKRLRVGWVGRINRVKRLQFLFEVAALMPDVEFHVAGKPDNDNENSYVEKLMTAGQKLQNVIMYGMVSREHMSGFYKNISALCCTSKYEGFPNTFIEAWSYGVPVVSTVDPDCLLEKRGLGICAVDVVSFTKALRKLLSEQDYWRQVSSRGRRYYGDNHLIDSSMKRFEENFLSLSSP